MTIDLSKDHKTVRKQLWTYAWVQIAASSNTTHLHIPTEWADECLAKFDERFPVDKQRPRQRVATD